MEKYEWLPTECADEGYPMQIINGDFIFSDNTTLYIPDNKVINNGWGEMGSSHIVGDDLKPLPGRLDITWFSYAEDTFYSGGFALPIDKLQELFKEGFISPSTGEETTYNRIVVGLAPEGEISLWLAGDGVVEEIDHFLAKEAPIEWEKVLDNEDVSRSEYIDMVLVESLGEEGTNHLRRKGVPSGLWRTYRKKYNWEPEILGIQPQHIWVKTFNGEKEFIKPPTNQSSNGFRAIPKVINLNWLSAGKKTYTAKIFFNEEEVFKAFQNFSNPKGKLYLQIEVSDTSHTIVVFLRDDQSIVELKHTAVKVYRL